MKKARTLQAGEAECLQRLLRSYNTIIHRRARIVVLSADGRKVSEIAEMVGVSLVTVYKVIERFNENGLESLEPGKSPGRPPKFSTTCSDKLIELVRKKPADFGIESGVWTLEEAAKAAQDQRIVESICPESMRQVLLRAGLSWKRVKAWIAPSDPAYEIKKNRRDWAIATALSSDDYDLEFADESWFVAQQASGIMNPQMGSAWTEDGKLVKVPASRSKGKMTLSIYAGLSLKSGQINYRFTHKNNTDQTIEYLKMRSEQCKAKGLKRLYIVWDNASFHISKKLKGWLRDYNKGVRKSGGTLIHLVALPSKSPWLNPIEAVFRWLKRRALLCRIHETLEVLTQTVTECISRRNSLAPACNVNI